MSNAMTDKQSSFIQRLCAERMQALTTTHSHLLQQEVVTTRDASNLIAALKAVPQDPRAVDPAEQARIDALKANVPSLSPRDATFALSLIQQWESRGSLSQNQWPHVDRLAAPAPEATCDPQVGDVVLANGDYYLIVLGKTGNPYAKRLVGSKWEFVKGGMAIARSGAIVTGSDLAAFAKNYGDSTRHCVFCALELTDQRSKDAGYGPTCAAKRGLPWGVSA